MDKRDKCPATIDFNHQSLALIISTMAPQKRSSHSFELKNEIIQMVKSGMKRSKVMKKYGISVSTLSEWMSASEKISAKVNKGHGKWLRHMKEMTKLLIPKYDIKIQNVHVQEDVTIAKVEHLHEGGGG